MKKILYLFLAVSFIFTACKKEEGCTDSTATNYNAEAEEDDGSCNYNLVGKWTATNLSIDSTQTVTDLMSNTIINSLSSAGTRTVTAELAGTPTSLEFLSNGTVYAHFSYDNYIDTSSYTINGNVLILDEEASLHYAINNSSLSLVGGEEFNEIDTIDVGNGPMAVEIYYLYTNTLNFTRNTSGIVDYNTSRRFGDTANDNWFNTPKKPAILKDIK